MFYFEVRKSQNVMFCSPQRQTQVRLSCSVHFLRRTLDAKTGKVKPYGLQLQISLGSLIGVNNTPDFSSSSFSVCLFILLGMALALSSAIQRYEPGTESLRHQRI